MAAPKQRSEYLDLRRRFEPASATVVVVAELPPVSGLYFYNPDGKASEPLFAALMKQLGVQPRTKLEGLTELQKQGWALVDATYEPVDGLTGRGRDLVIDRDYPELRSDLRRLMADHWSVTQTGHSGRASFRNGKAARNARRSLRNASSLNCL